MKNEMRSEIYLFWLSCVVFLSSAWKNVGMAMTCNRCLEGTYGALKTDNIKFITAVSYTTGMKILTEKFNS